MKRIEKVSQIIANDKNPVTDALPWMGFSKFFSDEIENY